MGCGGSKTSKPAPVDKSTQYDQLFKLVLLGDANVGKSSLVIRFCDNTYIDGEVGSIGGDFKVKFLTVGKKRVKLQLWDTAGQEKYRQMTASYFGGARGVVVCFDLSQDFAVTSANVGRWIQEAKSLKASEVVFFLVGTKSDLPRKASLEDCKALAANLGASFYETSAKLGSNVEETFQSISDKCMDANF